MPTPTPELLQRLRRRRSLRQNDAAAFAADQALWAEIEADTQARAQRMAERLQQQLQQQLQQLRNVEF